MIFLSVLRADGPHLAVKTATGVLVLDDARLRGPGAGPALPLTLEAALAASGGLDEIQHRAARLVRQAESMPDLFLSESDLQLGPPLRPNNLICIGVNYADHAQESGVKPPERPIMFAKLRSAVCGPGHAIRIPPDTTEVDYEAELAVVIGRRCRGISAADALEYVAGYLCLNDVSARDFQRLDGQWVRAKSQDTFAPMGPYLVTRDEVPDPQNLAIRCMVNGQVLQDSHTSRMVFTVRELIAFISAGITLEPGDVIATGTPPGVGFARNPQKFLRDGDEVAVEIERLGRLVNQVRG